MTILLSIDDTDSLSSRGTGRLARAIADALAAEFPVHGVTRHQFYVHPDIPFTSHNSNAVIHIGATGAAAADRIFARAQELMLDDFIDGSDPGVAVAPAEQVAPALVAFGQDAKRSVVTQQQARALAENLHIRLKGLGGTEDGVIGAMAGLGLAVTGNDGRYLQKGGIRDIAGTCTVEQLLAAGVDLVSTFDGRTFTGGTVLAREGKPPRPCPVNGKTVLFVELQDGVLREVQRD
jgi:hypothetical protein